MTVQQKADALNNSLIHFNFDSNYFIQSVGSGVNSKFAIAVKNTHGGISPKTAFYTYNEMNVFIVAYTHGTSNSLKLNV